MIFGLVATAPAQAQRAPEQLTKEQVRAAAEAAVAALPKQVDKAAAQKCSLIFERVKETPPMGATRDERALRAAELASAARCYRAAAALTAADLTWLLVIRDHIGRRKPLKRRDRAETSAK